MPSTVHKEPLSKQHYQNLILANDPSVILRKPPSARSELWSNFSQLHHFDIAQDYIVCTDCRIVLKWTSETGTKVMKNHNCGKKTTSKTSTPARQRTISSYLPPPQEDYSTIKARITEAAVEFCAQDNRPFETVAGEGFLSLARQLINTGASIGTGVSVNELLPHPTTVSIKFFI
jgi:hypothetical protein